MVKTKMNTNKVSIPIPSLFYADDVEIVRHKAQLNQNRYHINLERVNGKRKRMGLMGIFC
jgi:hypothetical protein